MWAATGCHTKVGCETASCLRNRGYPDGFCPPSTGPTGPVTKAEFTLASTSAAVRYLLRPCWAVLIVKCHAAAAAAAAYS